MLIIQTKFGDTALIRAATEGHLETVRALIDAGVDVNHPNKLGDTALKIATKR